MFFRHCATFFEGVGVVLLCSWWWWRTN